MMMGLVDGNVAAAAAAYSGPGDIISGATAWWGLRAYTLASIGGNCVDIIRASDSTTQTFVTVAGGGVDVASIATFLASTTGKVSKLYDQTGNGHDLTQATDSNRPAFTLSAIGSLPAMTFTRSSSNLLSNSSFVFSQPYTVSIVFNDTGVNGTSYSTLFARNSEATGVFGNDGATNKIETANPTVLSVTSVTNGSWHAIQAVGNGTSSDMNVDGTAHTGSSGTNAYDSVRLGGSVAFFDGKITEAGFWNSAFTSTNSSNMSSNQHSYWGF